MMYAGASISSLIFTLSCILPLIILNNEVSWLDIPLLFVLLSVMIFIVFICQVLISINKEEEKFISLSEDYFAIGWHFFSFQGNRIPYEAIEAITINARWDLASQISLKASYQFPGIKERDLYFKSIPETIWINIARERDIPFFTRYWFDIQDEEKEFFSCYSIIKDLEDKSMKISEKDFLKVATQMPELIFQGQTEVENTQNPRILAAHSYPAYYFTLSFKQGDSGILSFVTGQIYLEVYSNEKTQSQENWVKTLADKLYAVYKLEDI